jgi:hypothetical protein
LSNLREELIRIFQNPFNLGDESLFIEETSSQQLHNNLSPLSSPLFSPSDLPSPFHLSPIPLPKTTMPNPVHMPARGERAAPTFDKSKPRELLRFFDELEYLLARAEITDHAEMKRQVLRFVDFDTEQIWKTFPEFSQPTSTYKEFKDAVLVHYPDASGEYIYSLRDMDLLIGERQRIGINSTQDLADYHLQFLAITSWLIDKAQLGILEQQRAYIRAFPPNFMAQVMNRLQMKSPDHHPNKPHKIQDVYEAGRFILQSSNSAIQGYFAPLFPAPTPKTEPATSTSPLDPAIKTESLGTILSEFTKSIVEAISQNNRARPYIGNSAPRERNTDCNFCGEGHFIRECPVVNDYVRAGKCKRNHEGKIVLPSGAFIPRDIPGTLLRERFDEWHHRNPNQLAAASLIHTIDRRLLYPPAPVASTISSSQAYQLSATDRIVALEAELFNLRARKSAYVPVARTRAQKARESRVEDDEEDAEAVKAARQSRIEEVVEEDGPTLPEPRKDHNTPIVNTSASQPTTEPEHPFRNAKDAAYSPPTDRNVGSIPKAPVTNKKQDPAYKTLPPVHDPLIAANVYNRSMEAPITITQRELLSLSPEVRSQVREATTTRRVVTKDNAIAQNALLEDEDDDEHYSTAPTFAMPYAQHRTPPEGAIVLPDPIEKYYKSLGPGQFPDHDKIIVAKESSAVRSIFSLVENNQKHECILDPGCQIIAMSEDVCHDLALAYDPTIKLNMQSANGTIDQSLGLARNVSFLIGSVTLYMQVHVIRSPAYDILLGRPFDILTESIVRNFANEDQTITINDPNTGTRVTIPTLPRGHSRSFKISETVFQRRRA